MTLRLTHRGATVLGLVYIALAFLLIAALGAVLPTVLPWTGVRLSSLIH